jgi:hypothetical protein
MAKKKASPILLNWQGAQILSDDLYLSYHEETKNAAQRRSWTFYEAIKIQVIKKPLLLLKNKSGAAAF